MIAPERVYRELLREPAAGSVLLAIRRPAFVGLVIAVSLSIAATSILPARLLLSTFLCWSFAPAVQAIAGAALIGFSRQREVGMARALDLLFAGHAPWSLWLLVFGAAAAGGPGDVVSMAMWWSLPVPVLWTAWILRGFCSAVLNEPGRRALLGIALHQGIIWTCALVYIVTAISWARLIPFIPFIER